VNYLRGLLIISVCLLFTSCANYISQMHREFDRSDGAPPPVERDKFALYRKGQRDQRPMVNSQNNPSVIPSIKRQYEPQDQPKKRFKARDIADNASDGSLWSGAEGKNNFLFTENKDKSNGEILLLKIAGKLKNEITAELKRAYPSPIKRKGKDAEKKDPEKEKAPATADKASEEESDVDAGSDKVYDRISSVVVEEINQDHLLIRGRKNVLYKNRKRVVEVQALISRRDILDDDTVHSNKVLESQVVVLR
jgi:flagellar L-ring protein precursor FlgH